MNALLKDNFKFIVVVLAVVLLIGFWISGRSGPTRVWNWSRGDRTKINNRGDDNRFDWRKDTKVEDDEDPDETEDERRRRRRIFGSDGNELNESDEMDPTTTTYVLIGLGVLAGIWFLVLTPEQRKKILKRKKTDPEVGPEEEKDPDITREDLLKAFCILYDGIDDQTALDSLDKDVLPKIMKTSRV